MKAIGKQAAKILKKFIDQIPEGQSSIKVDNRAGTFMALHVERIGEINYGGTNFPLYSFAHYGEQNGDAMRDPDVVMMMAMIDGEAVLYPVSYRNDYVGKEDNVMVYGDDGSVKSYYPKMQSSIASFCNMWAKNLKEQQMR